MGVGSALGPRADWDDLAMSMIMCTRCDRMIDSDDNPECFVHDREGNITDEVWCESCWCDALDKREEDE